MGIGPSGFDRRRARISGWGRLSREGPSEVRERQAAVFDLKPVGVIVAFTRVEYPMRPSIGRGRDGDTVTRDGGVREGSAPETGLCAVASRLLSVPTGAGR